MNGYRTLTLAEQPCGIFVVWNSRRFAGVTRRRRASVTIGRPYPARSLTRMPSAGTPSTSASANPASAPCRTSAFDQLVWPGGR